MKNMQSIALVVLVALAGCGQMPIKVAADEPVIVTTLKYIPIPASMLVPCEQAIAASDALKTNGSLYAAWQHDSLALGVCGNQILLIEQLMNTEKNP